MMHPSAVGGRAQTWEVAWGEALYGPGGFYRHHAPAAHFATSAQGVPGGGEVLAQAVVALARRHGCTRLVDVGCGRGELLHHVRDLDPGLRLTGLDVVPAPPGLDVDDWLVAPGGGALPPGLADLEDTLVLAHEWLDVVPCPVAARDGHGAWRTLRVDTRGREEMGPPLAGEDLRWARAWLPQEVVRAEIGHARDLAFTDLVGRVRSGVVVAVDYGHTTADRPRHGTLTGFRGGREVPPVPDGSCDLTAHVAVDSLAGAGARAGGTGEPHLLTQREALLGLLPDRPPTTPVPHGLAQRDPSAYLAALARRGALAALTARGGLGDFWWVVAPVRPGA